MAITAFVLGLCGFIPGLGVILALVGVILGIVALGRSCGCGLKGLAIAGIVIGSVTMIVQPVLLVPAIQRAVELANRAACAANLNSLGKAVAIHRAEDRNARFPKNTEVLIERGLITEDAFKCPSVEHGGRSYFYYFPAKEPDNWSGKALMACDLKDNHGGEGRAVAYISGAARFMKEAEFQELLALPENADFARAMKDAGLE